MSSVRRLFSTISWPLSWAYCALFVLLLAPPSRHLRAVGPPPVPPSEPPRVSGGQVQLDVVVAQLRPGITRDLVCPFLKHSATESSKGRGPLPFFGLLDSPDAARNFRGVMEALRKLNQVKLVAEPRLVTLSGRPASFLSGGEQAVPVFDGSGQVGVQFEEFGIRLNFVPTVLGNGKIHLEVEPEISQLNSASGTAVSGTLVPSRTTSRVHTTVELEPAQTFVIGGLVQNNMTATDLKVPVLGDLPVVGSAFHTKTSSQEEVELIFLVTPSLTPSLVRRPHCEPTTEACSQEQTHPSAAKPHGQENTEHLRRLERRLKRLQEEVDDLRREIRSLPPTDPPPADGH
jgi:Flp pilus assembly secretin CpaC